MKINIRTGALMGAGLALVMLAASACAVPSNSQSTSDTPSGAPDRVDVVLFYSPDNCACMQNAKAWIETTISESYQQQVASGRLVYKEYDSTAAANADLKRQYDATNLSFYFCDVQGTLAATKEFKGLWLYLDTSLKDENLKAQFINLLKQELDKHLAGT